MFSPIKTKGLSILNIKYDNMLTGLNIKYDYRLIELVECTLKPKGLYILG